MNMKAKEEESQLHIANHPTLTTHYDSYESGTVIQSYSYPMFINTQSTFRLHPQFYVPGRSNFANRVKLSVFWWQPPFPKQFRPTLPVRMFSKYVM
jgi:hypothetical protein